MYFMLSNYSHAWDLRWSVVEISSDTTSRKFDIYFPSRYQMQLAYWLGVGICMPIAHFMF